MMLINEIKKDQLAARKLGLKLEALLLTTLMGEIETLAKRDGSLVSDELVQAVVQKFLKSNRETLEVSFGNTADLLTEQNILNRYLPSQLTIEQLHIVLEGVTNIGQGMKLLRTEYPNRYDGATARQVIEDMIE